MPGCGVGVAGHNKAARAMLANIEQLLQQRAPVGSDQGQVVAFISSQQWRHSGFESTKEGAVLKAWIPGIPSGVWYCDATGHVWVTFRFDHSGKLMSRITEDIYGCM